MHHFRRAKTAFAVVWEGPHQLGRRAGRARADPPRHRQRLRGGKFRTPVLVCAAAVCAMPVHGRAPACMCVLRVDTTHDPSCLRCALAVLCMCACMCATFAVASFCGGARCAVQNSSKPPGRRRTQYDQVADPSPLTVSAANEDSTAPLRPRPASPPSATLVSRFSACATIKEIAPAGERTCGDQERRQEERGEQEKRRADVSRCEKRRAGYAKRRNRLTDPAVARSETLRTSRSTATTTAPARRRTQR